MTATLSAALAGGCSVSAGKAAGTQTRTEASVAAPGTISSRTVAALAPPAAASTGPRHPRPSPNDPADRPSTAKAASGLPLAGRRVGIDPGHNGGNFTDPTYINRLIWNGREEEACNTTGTETDGGYTEALFNFKVGTYLAADLRAEGAAVVMTRTNNNGVGPCVNTRSEMLNRAHVSVALSIHADGGPPSGRGFAILEPVADGPNDRVIGASERFGHDLLERYLAVTGMPISNYDGTDGISTAMTSPGRT